MTDKDLACGKWLDTPCFLAESELLLRASCDAGLEIMEMLSTEAFPFPDLPCHDKRVVSAEEFERLTGYPQTRSVVGVVARPAERTLEQVLAGSHRVIIVEDSTNGANLAIIFRIAETFGIDAVLITHSCADPLFRRCARMSKGAVVRVPWARIGTQRDWSAECVPVMHQAGFELAALALSDDSISLADLPRCGKLALVMGTEGEGLMDSTVAACDMTVKIPMREGVDSLNVAAATAVACWQATRP